MYITYIYIYISHIYRNFKLEEAAFGDTQACKYRKTTSDCIMSNNCPTFMASEFHALVFFLQLQLDIIGASRLQYICSLIASMCVFRGLPVRTGLKGKSTDESDDTSFGVFMVPCHHRKLGAFLQMFPTKNPNPMMILQAFFNGAMCSCGATCQTDFPNGRTT